MTLKQALTESVRRFGKHARVSENRCRRIDATYLTKWPTALQMYWGRGHACDAMLASHSQPCPGNHLICSVGKVHYVAGMAFNMIEGTGTTFEEAFQAIDDRRARDRRELEERVAKDRAKAEATQPKVHLSNGNNIPGHSRQGKGICGKAGRLTDDETKVTCGLCKRLA